jgi:hypothetical protein
VKREVNVTGNFATKWHLPEVMESESLESLDELGEILAIAVVVSAVGQKYATRTHQAEPLRRYRDDRLGWLAETNMTL